MKSNYQDLTKLMQSYKAKYEAGFNDLEAITLDPAMPMFDYFDHLREIILQSNEFAQLISQDPKLTSVSLDTLKDINTRYYSELDPSSAYDHSYANPDFAVKQLGEEMGQLLSTVYLNIRMMRISLLIGNYQQAAEAILLYLDLLGHCITEREDLASLKACYLEATNKDLEIKTYWRYMQRFSPDQDYYKQIIKTADLADLRYLYRYGAYLNEDVIKMADFMSRYPAQDLSDIAVFVVQSWIDGFVRADKDYKKKSCANLMIPCGMERLGRLIIAELEKIGMNVIVPQPHTHPINKQYGYDHRFDMALNLDRNFVDTSLAVSAKELEELQDLLSQQAGPLYIELFGEIPFSPVAKASAIKLSPDQQQLYREFMAKSSQQFYKYYRRDESSFTIIAFPSTEIGERFEEIFADTLRINLLDSKKYATIQQHIIDLLDQADYVHVLGKDGNDTDIKVKMHKITEPTKQTNFENCVADVNIPVGEVFTSPVLEGTTGTLHVEDIYLGSLRYYNLKMHFEDGWIKDYSCSNFDDPAEGKKYIHENLLLPHESLPIGEFAIGTNTTAYQVAKKYDILHLLPILIIEKMGPHFAIGDTCFSQEEDAKHTSFVNGKEMIAVENEKSATRKTDPVNAYTQKHTDITLPYEMLSSITAVTPDGTRLEIIRDGRFVVPGTEELNIPLEQIL